MSRFNVETINNGEKDKFTILSCKALEDDELFDFSIISDDNPDITYSFFNVEIVEGEERSKAMMDIIIFRHVLGDDGVVEKQQIDIDDLEFEKWMGKAEEVFSEFFNHIIEQVEK